MNRRGFIQSILALGMAPAVVRSESLMRVVVPKWELLVPPYHTYPPPPGFIPMLSGGKYYWEIIDTSSGVTGLELRARTLPTPALSNEQPR